MCNPRGAIGERVQEEPYSDKPQHHVPTQSVPTQSVCYTIGISQSTLCLLQLASHKAHCVCYNWHLTKHTVKGSRNRRRLDHDNGFQRWATVRWNQKQDAHLRFRKRHDAMSQAVCWTRVEETAALDVRGGERHMQKTSTKSSSRVTLSQY